MRRYLPGNDLSCYHFGVLSLDKLHTALVWRVVDFR
jgi:hypothetical protein